jgi:hypothetical protein
MNQYISRSQFAAAASILTLLSALAETEDTKSVPKVSVACSEGTEDREARSRVTGGVDRGSAKTDHSGIS